MIDSGTDNKAWHDFWSRQNSWNKLILGILCLLAKLQFRNVEIWIIVMKKNKKENKKNWGKIECRGLI